MATDVYWSYLWRVKELYVRVSEPADFDILLQIIMAEAQSVLSKTDYNDLVREVNKYQDWPYLVSNNITAGYAINKASDRYEEEGSKAWDLAVAAMLIYILMKMRKDPKTDSSELNSPETLMFLEVAATRALTKTQKILDKAVTTGALMGYQQAKDTRNTLKLPRSKSYYPPIGKISDKLHHDLSNIASDMPKLALAAAKTKNEEAVNAVFKKISLRVRLVMEAAVKMHASGAVNEYLEGLDVRLVWKSSRSEPCSYCKKLHGSMIEPGEQFDAGSFPVYGGVLFGPTLHPNCNCYLVVFARKLQK